MDTKKISRAFLGLCFITFLHSWRLGLCKVYTALQILYLQRICHSICNNATVYQLVHYERLVAGGRCFYIFQLYRGGLRITK